MSTLKIGIGLRRRFNTFLAYWDSQSVKFTNGTGIRNWQKNDLYIRHFTQKILTSKYSRLRR